MSAATRASRAQNVLLGYDSANERTLFKNVVLRITVS
jgi:hypothetical protein